MRCRWVEIGVLGLVTVLTGAQAPPPASIDVTVHEGTSMSVAVSPDGRTLAVDLQGSIWTLPAAGGPATRITDIYNDARQPTWSPDGKWISFFAYRDGGYDIWTVAPDGSNQHKLTWGPFDDREPIWSHDGTRIAFSSDRGNALGSDYNIWMLDTRTGGLRQLTKAPSDDYMPSWSPDDKEIAFASAREDGQSVWAVNVADGSERKVSSAAGRVDAPSWGPNGQIVYHVTTGGGRGGGGGAEGSRYEIAGRLLTGSENVFAFRASWAASSDFFYVSDGKIRKRSAGGGSPQTVEFAATLQVTRADTAYTHRKRDFTSTSPCHAGGRQAGEHHQGSGARHRSVVVARRHRARVLVGQGQRASAALDPRHAHGPESSRHAPDDAAAGGDVVAGRKTDRLLQRGRHVAGRADVGPRRRERHRDESARHACSAGHADLVAGRKADRAGRGGAVHPAFPRRYQPGIDDRRRCRATLSESPGWRA
ncbi:MAG: hypothetical protein DMF96_04410 [Acidobacteria bacterium]|nr:MAG: hypothetical protein DMF96_04410 [Acidobacteriota bacterium]